MSNAKDLTYLNSVKDIASTPVVRQLIFLIGLSASIAMGIVLYTSIREPVYRPIDYQVNSQNMSAIIDTLEKSGIKYKINDTDGMLYVDTADVQLAKLKLSSAGIAKDDSFSFSFLNDKSNLGNSQFLENARYLRALENDLSKTISALEGVASARVHIAMPQNNTFADENSKPTASVVLSVAPGLGSDKEKIRAIIQIVASSVPGLDPKDVAVTDQYGHYLSNSMDEQSQYNAEQMSYQNNIQSYYEKRIESMIVPLIGENKVSVRVYADIDFSQQEMAKEEYDPNQKVIRSEQEQTESTGSSAASGVPGSLSNSPPEKESDKPASSQSTSQGKSQSVKNYELGKSVSYRKSNYAKINSLSVAVVVDNEVNTDPKTNKKTTMPIDKDKMAKINDLVKATIGFDDKRGDKVTIVNSSFTTPAVEAPAAPIQLWNQPWFWDMVKKIVGIILGFTAIHVLYRQLSKFMKSAEGASLPGRRVIDAENGQQLSQEMQQLKQEQIKRLKDLASKDPERVAAVIKSWVGK